MIALLLASASSAWASVAALFWIIAPYIDWGSLVVTAWVAVSAVINGVLDKHTPHTDEDWVTFYARHPRLAALAKIVRSIGATPQTFITNVRTIFTGKPPAIILAIAAKLNKGDKAGVLAMRDQIERDMAAKFAYEKSVLEEQIETLKQALTRTDTAAKEDK